MTAPRTPLAAAYAALYDQHHRTVYLYIYLHVGNEQGAHHLTTAVWLRAPDTLPPDADRVAVLRHTRNLLTRWGHHRPLAGGAVDLVEPADRALLNAVTELTARQQECATLHYLLHLPLGEIAQILGLRRPAVQQALHTGVLALQRRHPELAAVA